MFQGLNIYKPLRSKVGSNSNFSSVNAGGDGGEGEKAGGGGGGRVCGGGLERGGVSLADVHKGVKEELEGKSAYMKQVRVGSSCLSLPVLCAAFSFGFRLSGLGFRVSGFRGQGLGCRV
jgi:hypothetical protein